MDYIIKVINMLLTLTEINKKREREEGGGNGKKPAQFSTPVP